MSRRPAIFSVPTTLYHPTEGERVFPAGEQDPGQAWTDTPGGPAIGAATTTQALQDLVTAQDQIEGLEERLAKHAHDMDVIAKERDEALVRVDGLEQAVIAASNDAAEATQAARTAVAELDQTRGYAKTLEERAEKDAATIAALQAQLASFDGDGDGKPGGSKPRRAKAGPAGDAEASTDAPEGEPAGPAADAGAAE